MLMRTDPFREFDRPTRRDTWSSTSAMPLDAYRSGDEFVVALDLPGVSADTVDLDVDRNVLTVKAERRPATTGETQISERPVGVFTRQLVLGDSLDTDHIKADYAAGVLTLRIPVREEAKPRKIAIGTAVKA
jgi:HSP20 family protein